VHGNSKKIDKESGIVSQYANEIRQIPKLSEEEQKELFSRYYQGDMEARNLLIKHNLYVVANVGCKYIERLKMPLDDIISIGIIGLFKAIETYDEDYNIPLGAFVALCVNGELKTHIRHLKRQKRNNFNDISLQKNLTSSEEDDFSLEDIFYHENDLLEKEVEENNLSEKMHFILSKLSQEERELLILRFGLVDDEYRSCEAVGQMVGLEGERVRVKCKKAIMKLRHPKITRQIKDFL